MGRVWRRSSRAAEPLPLVFEEVDPVRKWREEADAQEARFEAARAARRSQECAAEDVRAADWWAAIDARIASALAQHHEQFAALATASATFADAVSARLEQLEKLLTKFDATHAKLREHDDQRGVVDLPNPLAYKVKEQRRIN